MTSSYVSGASRLALILAAATAAGSLAACDRNGPQTPDRVSAPQAAMALTTGPALPLTRAPSAQALPDVRPISVVEPPPGADDGYYYRYLDDADYMTTSFFDGPPDYTFDYGGVYPWAWRADDNALALAEPVSDGYRYYYYHPGDDYPFLVQDPDYAYGYNDGALITVFDSFGRVVPRFEYVQRAPIAARYLDRGRGLFQAARAPNRRAVTQAAWLERRAQVAAITERWARDRERNEGWRNFRAQHAPQQQAMWAPERYRREAAAARFFQRVNDPAASQRHWQQALQARAEDRQPRTLPQRAGFRAFNAGDRQAAAPPAQVVQPQPQTNPRQAEIEARREARVQQQAQVQAANPAVQQGQARQAAEAQRMQARQAQVQARQAEIQARAQQQGAQQAARAAQMQARQAEHAQAAAARNNDHAAAEASRMQARQAQVQAHAQQQAAHAAQAQARQQAVQARQAARQAAVIQPRPQSAQRQGPAPQARQGGGQPHGPQPDGGKEKDKHH
ncbi:MAG: hypothetical protein JSR45_04990 [Proteobacteria bacterium]|nr:hypothetical protein [Pseudomonadota bacterium]